MKSKEEIYALYQKLCKQYGEIAATDLKGSLMLGRKKALKVLAWILEIRPEDVETEVYVK